MDKYVLPNKAAAHYGVCSETLRKWAANGIVETYRTVGGHRRYKIDTDTITVEQLKAMNRKIIKQLQANFKEMDMNKPYNNMKDLKTLSADKAVIKAFLREFLSSNMNCREAQKAEYNTLQDELGKLNAEKANYQMELDAAIKVCTFNGWSVAPLETGTFDKITEEHIARRIIKVLTSQLNRIDQLIATKIQDIDLNQKFASTESELAAAFNVAKMFGLTVEVSNQRQFDKDVIVVEVK